MTTSNSAPVQAGPPTPRVRPEALAAFTLARCHAWPGVDNLAVARRLIFHRRRFYALRLARGNEK